MTGRRHFLGLAAGTAAMATIRRAAAIAADRRAGGIEDVGHIVVLMQENRSFDHYFASLRGVRGFGDRFALRLPGGRSVWAQARQGNPAQTVLPFHFDTARSAAQCAHWLDHSWEKTQIAIGGGRMDAWPETKTDMTMGFYRRADIPFHYALADAFTVCDQYFCSTPCATHPNRMFLMTGTNDPTGAGGGPLLDNNDVVDKPRLAPFTWTTYPERLQAAGISWQVYQQGLDWKDAYTGNYGLNVLQNFRQYIEAPEGSALHARAMSVRTLDRLRADATGGTLAQVSWVLPPAAFSEHPYYTPAYGATYVARVIEALTADPAVWARTVLLMMYDENDGYFDHVPPPQPNTPVLAGASTVSTAGEVHDTVNPLHEPFYTKDQLPYGLGPRVPMLAISPWSKGGFACSQVFDHTSVIRFIEARFGVAEPNISPWRRAVCGDLTSAFDFARPDARPARLPDTAGYRAAVDAACAGLPAPVVPQAGAQAMPAPEPGVRRARPLAYEMEAAGHLAAGVLSIRFTNTGGLGVHFYVHDERAHDTPRRYTLGAGSALSDTWQVGSGDFTLAVRGPNGFYRQFAGHGARRAQARFGVELGYAPRDGAVRIAMSGAAGARMTDGAYGARARALSPAEPVLWAVSASHHWYDLIVQAPGLRWRLAGHMETGAAGFTDPAAGAEGRTAS